MSASLRNKTFIEATSDWHQVFKLPYLNARESQLQALQYEYSIIHIFRLKSVFLHIVQICVMNALLWTLLNMMFFM